MQGKPNDKIDTPPEVGLTQHFKKTDNLSEPVKPMARNADCGYLSVMREPIAVVCFPCAHLQQCCMGSAGTELLGGFVLIARKLEMQI